MCFGIAYFSLMVKCILFLSLLKINNVSRLMLLCKRLYTNNSILKVISSFNFKIELYLKILLVCDNRIKGN